MVGQFLGLLACYFPFCCPRHRPPKVLLELTHDRACICREDRCDRSRSGQDDRDAISLRSDSAFA